MQIVLKHSGLTGTMDSHDDSQAKGRGAKGDID
jgi:hypothetical protein